MPLKNLGNMRYLYVLGFTFLFFMQSINAQVQGYYTHDLDSNRSILLKLYPNNMYSLTWMYFESDDFYTVGRVSHGNWRINQGKIILTDRTHNFQTICSYKNVTSEQMEITIEESFKWLNGLGFEKRFEMDNDELPKLNDIPWTYELDLSLAQKEREKHYNDENENSLYFGEYTLWHYLLWIYPNNTYMLNISLKDFFGKTTIYNDFSHSEGTWEKNGNVLTLFDKSVKCHFYLIITDNGLKPNQMIYIPWSNSVFQHSGNILVSAR